MVQSLDNTCWSRYYPSKSLKPYSLSDNRGDISTHWFAVGELSPNVQFAAHPNLLTAILYLPQDYPLHANVRLRGHIGAASQIVPGSDPQHGRISARTPDHDFGAGRLSAVRQVPARHHQGADQRTGEVPQFKLRQFQVL